MELVAAREWSRLHLDQVSSSSISSFDAHGSRSDSISLRFVILRKYLAIFLRCVVFFALLNIQRDFYASAGISLSASSYSHTRWRLLCSFHL